MIKICFDSSAVFFEFEGEWTGTLLYIGNNKFYFKFKSSEGMEDACLFTAYNYIVAILHSLEKIALRDERVKRACQMTAQMITRGGELRTTY